METADGEGNCPFAFCSIGAVWTTERKDTMKKLKVILIGAGGRGTSYTNIMYNLPEQFEVIAVAEPLDARRNYIREKHNIPDEMCFTDWKPLLALGKIADVALIATMDRDHYLPAVAAVQLKYDLLLEKPITPEPEECKHITELAAENGVKVIICTVLRYTDLFMKLKEIIDSGRIGKVMSINHEECVGNTHQSHSFVRGNWGNSSRSSSMLLQKSCHDIDILQWLIGKKCKSVQSFGTLSYFRKENAPEGSPEYCIQGCPHADTCHYNAVKLYLEEKDKSWFAGHACHMTNPSEEKIREVITNTQYGKCVFKCDNDVVDHQTVNMLFEDDITVTFSMNAFNAGGRFIHICGTKGELRAATDGKTPISFFDFDTRKTEEISLTAGDGISTGHGGGDEGIIRTLYQYLTGTYTGKSVPSIQESCYNHLITFAAEESRRTNAVVDFDAYVENLKNLQ